MTAPNLRKAGAVLELVKAWPGNVETGSAAERRPTLTSPPLAAVELVQVGTRERPRSNQGNVIKEDALPMKKRPHDYGS